MASIYVAKHKNRAVILVMDELSKARAGGHSGRADDWHRVRERIWAHHGFSV